MPAAKNLCAAICACISLGFLNTGPVAAAAPLYEHPANYPGSFSFLTSSRGVDGSGFRTWDSFMLAESAHIGGLSWQGVYRDFVNRGNNPVGPNTISWEVSLWADQGGAPSLMVQTRALLATEVQTQFAGTASITPFGSDIADTINVYDFHAELSAPFYAVAGTTYWLSIVSNAPSDNPLWGWMSGTGGDNATVQEALVGATRFDRARDRAFSLEAVAAVPEPGTYAFLAAGLAALLMAASRRSRSTA